MQIKTLSLLLLPLVLGGCVQISGTYRNGEITITSRRWFWASEGLQFTLNEGGTNLQVGLQVQKSNADAQALGAIAEGMARGLATGMK